MLLQNKTIFIVEDNLQNRIVFQMLLIQNGAKVEFERWGRSAMQKLKSLRHVDIILLDLGLAEGVTGYDVYDQIRAMPEFNEVPVVAVSATDPLDAIPKTRSKGFNGFIAKPIDDNRFPQQLARLIQGDSIWDAGGVIIEDEEI